jgi:hypothetical protein
MRYTSLAVAAATSQLAIAPTVSYVPANAVLSSEAAAPEYPALAAAADPRWNCCDPAGRISWPAGAVSRLVLMGPAPGFWPMLRWPVGRRRPCYSPSRHSRPET